MEQNTVDLDDLDATIPDDLDRSNEENITEHDIMEGLGEGFGFDKTE